MIWFSFAGSSSSIVNTCNVPVELIHNTNLLLNRIIVSSEASDRSHGEIAWVNFLNYVKKYKRDWNYEALGKIKGLCYFNKAKELVFNGLEEAIPAEDLPFPDYDLLQSGLQDQPEAINNYFSDGPQSKWFYFDERTFETHRLPKIAHVTISKGCVARCTFCQRSFKGYWVPDIGSFEEHLIELKKRFNVHYSFFISTQWISY